MAQLVRDKNFSELSKLVTNDIAKILNAQPIVVLEKAAGKNAIIEAIEFEIIKCAAQVNIDQRLNIQRHQVPIIAETLFETFKTESLEDFILCLRRGSFGFYDEKLLRLDGAVIITWMRKFLEEKYYLVESDVLKSKAEDQDSQIDYAAFKKRLEAERARKQEKNKDELQKERDRQLKEIGLDDFRESYQSKREKVIEHEKHLAYIRENYNADGTKKENWKPE